jgi:hypothetical protein
VNVALIGAIQMPTGAFTRVALISLQEQRNLNRHLTNLRRTPNTDGIWSRSSSQPLDVTYLRESRS